MRPPAVTGGQVPLVGALVLIDMEVGVSCERCICTRGGVKRKHCICQLFVRDVLDQQLAHRSC